MQTDDSATKASLYEYPTGELKTSEAINLDYDSVARYLELKSQMAGSANISVSLLLGGTRYSWSTQLLSSTQNRFHIGCVTKGLLAAQVLRMHEQGFVDIGSPIARYLPEFMGTRIGEEVLVKHLLSSTSGYLGFSFFEKASREMCWRQFVEMLSVAPQIFVPGSVCSLDYSNHVLLAEIVNRTSGAYWMDQVDEAIGMPLLGRPLFSEKDRNRFWSAAAASTELSSDELLSLGEVFMTGRTSSGAALLSVDNVHHLQNMVVESPRLAGGRCTLWLPQGHGHGLSVYRSGLRGECGKWKKELSSVRFHQEMKMALAVCVGSSDTFLRHEVMDAVLVEVGLQMPMVQSCIPLQIDPRELAGEYIGMRGIKVTVGLYGTRITIEMSQCNGANIKCTGAVSENGLSLDLGQSIAGIGFFRAPVSGMVAMKIGVHALRRACVN